MLDFNTKKKILKRLSDCAEKHFIMLIPCLIAAGCVKLFYFIVCNIDIALSDKEGNFLGIKHKSGEKTPKKKKDDIVYVKRSFWSRAVSLVLTFAFVCMFVPAIESFAAGWTSDYQTDDMGYYYDAGTPGLPAPVINSTGCVEGSTSYKVAWDPYNYGSLTTTLPAPDGFTRPSGSLFAIDVCYQETGSSATDHELKYKRFSVSSYSNSMASMPTSYVITGLDPDKEYDIFVRAVQCMDRYTPNNVTVDADGKTVPVAGANAVKGYFRYYESSHISKYQVDYMNAPLFNAEYVLDKSGMRNQKYVYINITQEVPEADGYLVYKSANNGTYSLLTAVDKDNIPAEGILDDSIELTSVYRYTVVAARSPFGLSVKNYVGNEGSFFTSALPTGSVAVTSAVVYTDTQKPYPVEITDNRTYFTLSWNSVPRATSYVIKRRLDTETDDQALWITEIQSDGSKSYSYDDTTALNGVSYTYIVYAVNSLNIPEPNSEYVYLIGKKLNTNVSRPYNFRGEGGDTSVTLYCYCDDDQVTGFDIEMVKVTTDADGNEVVSEPSYIDASAVSAKISTDKNGRTSYSFTEYDLSPGAVYRFRIRSYMIIGNSQTKEPTSDYIPNPPIEIKAVTEFRAPQEIEAVPDDGQITVNWTASPTATGYRLYILKKNGTKYQNLGYRQVSDTTYVHTGLKNGDTYQYYVIATKTVNGQTIESDPSDTVEATVGNPLKKPTDLTPKQVGDNVEITWKAVDGAEGYYLYIVGNGTTDIKDLTTNSYTQTDARYGVTYSYYVYAYKSIKLLNGTYQSYQSERSDIETLTIGGTIGFPGDLKATPSEGQIDLTWTAVPDAAGYVVYATCNGNTETFNVTTNSFSHTGLTAGKTYTYYVVAYKIVNGVPVYSIPSASVSATVGGSLAAPTDFTVTTAESSATLKWTAVSGAEGYTVYGVSSDGQKLEIDVSKTTYTHTGLISGDTWTYYVKAYKTINNQRVYSSPTTSITVKIGATLPAPTDLVATSGNRQVDLKWTQVKNADGYIVYVYDDATATFQPVSIVSKTTYSHTGLKNGQKYTYMVAAYKIINGERVIGDYSLSVSAIPTAGNAADVDFTINVKGTVPYGISHSELISAAANHDAFDEPVDAYFSVNDESTRAIKEVLRGYANGLKSFIIYPFDINLYLENTLVEVEPNEGFNVTFTIPVPDQMIGYRDYITVVHLKTDGTDTIIDDSDDDIFISSTELEVLPSAIIDVNGVWCVQFTTDSCSPFAFVIYRDNLDDVSSGGASSAGGASAGTFNTGVLLFTALPDIMPTEKKTKFVVATKKRYRIKK